MKEVIGLEQAAQKGRVGTNLTEGPIMKGLLMFAIPIVLTNLVQQLYSMVDLIVIGQYVGSVGTVGVNTGGEFADMVSPIAMGFSTAGQIYIAQLVGAREDQKVKRTVGTLLSFMMLASVVLCVLGVIFCRPILSFLNCPEEAVGQATAYMIITALGTPFVFGYNAVCGILRGMGESKRPLYFILVAASVNIVLDLLLVVVFHMEAAGTAIATTASQLGSFLAAFFFMWKKKEKFDFEPKLSYFKMEGDILWVLVKLGIPQVVRSLFVRTGMLWVNANANAYGLVVSATNSVGNKLQKFLEVFIQGIDTASASMVGQNLGAKKTERAGKTTLCTAAAAVVCAAFSALLCLFFPHQIFGIFTKDAEVIALGATFLRIFILHFFASAITGSFQAMVTGCGFVELGFVLGLLDGVICKIGLSVLFMNVFHMGYLGLWWGVACSRILPGCICVGYYLSGKWKTWKLLTEK
jgi:putative MATE family efflux protein